MPARRETAPTVPRPTHVAAFEAITSDPNQRLVCAVEDGVMLGIMQLTFIPGLARNGAWRMEVEGMRVRVEQRSQGIGEQMIRWATDRARERECSVVQLTATPAASTRTGSTPGSGSGTAISDSSSGCEFGAQGLAPRGEADATGLGVSVALQLRLAPHGLDDCTSSSSCASSHSGTGFRPRRPRRVRSTERSPLSAALTADRPARRLGSGAVRA